MKKFVQWLAKVFNANIIKEVKVIEYKDRYLTSGIIQGSVYVEGDLFVNGKISATGSITCANKKEDKV